VTVLILGANGFIGRHISSALFQAGFNVKKAVRRQSSQHNDNSILIDIQNADETAWKSALEGIDVVINCVGAVKGNQNSSLNDIHVKMAKSLFHACRNSNVKHVIHFSALGASSNKPTEYQKTKGLSEELLAKYAHEKFTYSILRPSLIIGPGGASSNLFNALAAFPFSLKFSKQIRKVQPVLIDDICDLVVAIVTNKTPTSNSIDVVGPAPISLDEMINVLRTNLATKSWFSIKLPSKILELSRYFIGSLTNGILNKDTIAMMKEGNTASPKIFEKHLGRPPRDLSSLSLLHPCSPEERRNARIYFARPLLRWSLGLIWILTGLLSFGIYPIEKSQELLSHIVTNGIIANTLLFSSAALDLFLGIMLLINKKTCQIAIFQIILMLTYMIIATGLPLEYWLHPFAPILKNIPLIAATIVMVALEKD
jgi:nucleoside-diphosphate-sugar epimerase/uncharacterized membrane protein YphA (DoxX/SURF4 family)